MYTIVSSFQPSGRRGDADYEEGKTAKQIREAFPHPLEASFLPPPWQHGHEDEAEDEGEGRAGFPPVFVQQHHLCLVVLCSGLGTVRSRSGHGACLWAGSLTLTPFDSQVSQATNGSWCLSFLFSGSALLSLLLLHCSALADRHCRTVQCSGSLTALQRTEDRGQGRHAKDVN